LKLLALSALFLAASPLLAQPAPEECFATKKDRVVESAEHDGRVYRFKAAGCRALFESEPERYAQLFDALAEMDAQGAVVAAPEASLVPS
jgi:YHS domain-containing protein